MKTKRPAPKRKTSNAAKQPRRLAAAPLFGAWLASSSAPKDGTQLLGDFGYPWPLVASWNTHDNQWVTACMNAQGMRDGTTDIWFESEREEMSQMRRWTPLPLLPNVPALAQPDDHNKPSNT